MMKMSFAVVSVLTLTLRGGALGAEIRIASSSDFIVFINNVNSGSSNYTGTTVLLDADLSFSGVSVDPIGKDSYNQFFGVFDGQGHVISDFRMNSSSIYTGLFGYSDGLTIRNVVLDSSCSITSSYTGPEHPKIGSIIGKCASNSVPCIIENAVNMADVTFNENLSDNRYVYLGGIAGSFSSSSLYSTSKCDISVKNCANYGSIIHSGYNTHSFIGGIVGNADFMGNKYLQNCANYGTITHSGTTTNTLNIGGIVGWSYYISLENCLSAGRITSNNTNGKGTTGSITGCISGSGNVNITYCYFTSDVGVYKISGEGTPSNMTGTPTSASVADSTLIDNLNSQVTTENGFNQWVFNPNSTVSLNKNNAHWLSSQSKVILLPSLSTGGDYAQHNFVGWFTDDLLTTPLSAFSFSNDVVLYCLYGKIINITFDPLGGVVIPSSKTTSFNNLYGRFPIPTKEGFTFVGWFTEDNEEVTPEIKVSIPNDHTLSAKWTAIKHTISFEPNGGSECPDITQDYDTPITLPKPNKTGYTFVHWCSDSSLNTEYIKTTMPAENTTLYGKWTPNNYNVSFNPNGGSVTLKPKKVTFDSSYGDLPTPNKTGFTFVGWFTENNESVTSESIVAIPNDHTLFAHWAEIPSTKYVEIVFETRDLSDEEIKEIIKQYTDDEFTIERFEDEGELRIIVKFEDVESAKIFFENVNTPSETNLIKRAGFLKESDGSLSSLIYPISFFLSLVV